MTEFFMEKRQISLTREFQIMHGDITSSRRWNLNPPVPSLLCPEFGLPLVTCFQRVKYGKEGSNFTAENPDKRSLSQVIKINIISGKSYWKFRGLDITMRMVLRFGHLLSKNLSSQANHEKNVRKPQIEGLPQNTWTILLRTVKVTQSKESLRNCYGKEAKKIWQLNVIWHPGWDTGKVKGP